MAPRLWGEERRQPRWAPRRDEARASGEERRKPRRQLRLRRGRNSDIAGAAAGFLWERLSRDGLQDAAKLEPRGRSGASRDRQLRLRCGSGSDVAEAAAAFCGSGVSRDGLRRRRKAGRKGVASFPATLRMVMRCHPWRDYSASDSPTRPSVAVRSPRLRGSAAQSSSWLTHPPTHARFPPCPLRPAHAQHGRRAGRFRR